MFGLYRKLFDKIKSKSKNIRIHGHQIQCFTSIIFCQLTNVKSNKSNTLLSSMCVCWHSMHCNMKQIVSWNYRNCLFLLFLSNRKHQIKILIACQFLYFLEKKEASYFWKFMQQACNSIFFPIWYIVISLGRWSFLHCMKTT